MFQMSSQIVTLDLVGFMKYWCMIWWDSLSSQCSSADDISFSKHIVESNLPLSSQIFSSADNISFSKSAITRLDNLISSPIQLSPKYCPNLKILPHSILPYSKKYQSNFFERISNVIRRRDVIHVSDNQLSSSFHFQISRNIMPPKYKIFHNIYCMAGQSKAGGKSQVFRVLTILPTNGKMPFREFAKFVVVSAFSRTSPVTISKFRFFSFTCSIWMGVWMWLYW